MVYMMLILAITTLVAGFALRYWINRRKFYRRNVAGLETFSNYEESVFIGFLERVGKWITYALIASGILFLFVYSSWKKEKEKKERVEKLEKKS